MSVTMVNPFSNTLYLLPPLIATFVIIVLAFLVIIKSRWDLSSRLFCFFLLSLGLSSLFTFFMRSSPDVHYALIWEKILIIAGMPAFAFYYHFTISYTNIKRKKLVISAIYTLIAVLAVIVAATDLGIKEMYIEYYGYAPVKGPMLSLIFVPAPLLIVGGAYNLIRRYKVSASYEERNRLLYLAIAALFPLFGSALDGFTDLPPASIWSNLVFSSICTIAILKYHLLDIRVVIKKGLVYLFASAVVAVPYVIILLLLNQILKTRIEPWWAHAFIILLLAILLRPLYSWAQHLVDKMFYRDRYDYLKALERFSGEAQSVTNLGELGSSVIKLAAGALRASSISLLLSSQARRGMVVVSSSGLNRLPSEPILRGSSPIIKWLSLHGGPLASEKLDIIPQLQGISLTERNKLNQLKGKLYIPIRPSPGLLSGILVLGEKLSQQAYSVEDIQLLTTVSSQLAMAIDNARLYEETKQSEEKLRLMYQSMTEGIVVLDLEGNISHMNEAAFRMYGYESDEELVKKNLFKLIASKYKANALRTLKKTLKNRHVNNIEHIFLRRDGSEFNAELSIAVLEDQSSNPTGFVVVIKDITERKQAEEREKRLQQELNLSSRLASIGELAAGVAHELNNPLTGIIGFSERILRKSKDLTIRRDLERVFEQACRAAKVVENLRTFARHREPKKERIDINDVLQKALEIVAYELKTSNIKVVSDLTLRPALIVADFHQIQQVFLNIILNAVQAIKETKSEGEIVVKTGKYDGILRITFTDDGPGIPQENLSKLFDPFFTTRGEKGGTGLGLSISHGIVAQHGGKIYASSEVGEGTTFFIELPHKP